MRLLTQLISLILILAVTGFVSPVEQTEPDQNAKVEQTVDLLNTVEVLEPDIQNSKAFTSQRKTSLAFVEIEQISTENNRFVGEKRFLIQHRLQILSPLIYSSYGLA